jgi:acyl-CoA synthetase (AMP-forming)/AMP-acid ligase II
LDADRRLTYAEVAEECRAFARQLSGEGIVKGDRVAVLGYSRIECLIALLAITSIGAIYVGMNPKYTRRELDHVLQDSQPRLLFLMTQLENAPSIPSLMTQLPETKVVTLWDDDAERPSWTALSAWLKQFRSAEEPEAQVGREDPGVIIYTSGSTGIPKGALIPHRALVHAADLSTQGMWGGVPKTIVDYPINHVAWVVETCLAALFAGGTLYFRERFDPRETLRLVEREKLNSLLLISSMLIACTRTSEFEELDLSSVDRLLFVAPIDSNILERMSEKLDATLVTGLGMTETAGGYTFTDADADLETLVNTVGKAHESVEVKIVDAAGRELDAGSPGEILVRGRSVFLGYLNRPDATREVLGEDGFLRTGDIAFKREDGNIQVVGRSKEMFKSGGYNVYPTEVEAVISEHPHIAMTAVVPVPDETWGEVGVAFVVPHSGAEVPNEEELKRFGQERLANYKVPKRFVVRPRLPVLPNGKVDRTSLRSDAAREGKQTGPSVADPV